MSLVTWHVVLHKGKLLLLRLGLGKASQFLIRDRDNLDDFGEGGLELFVLLQNIRIDTIVHFLVKFLHVSFLNFSFVVSLHDC